MMSIEKINVSHSTRLCTLSLNWDGDQIDLIFPDQPAKKMLLDHDSVMP